MWTTNGDFSFFCETNGYYGRKIWSKHYKVNSQTPELSADCEIVAALLSNKSIQMRFGGQKCNFSPEKLNSAWVTPVEK
ncbi:MAG: hypothetical protein ACJAZW_000174 [Maritalea sp.]